MVNRPDTNKARQKRHKRVRAKISGTAACPRLDVFRSLQHIYAQLIDDVAGVTLVAASTTEKDFTAYGGNVEAARAVVETVGIKDIRSKALRSNNPCNVVRATIDGLSKLRNADTVAAVRGKTVKEILE